MLRMEGCSPRSLVSRMFLYIDVVIMLLVIHTICQDMIEVFRFMQWWTESLIGLTQEEEKLQREKTVALAREKLVQDSLKKTEQRRGRCAAHIADIARSTRSTCNLNVFMRIRCGRMLCAHQGEGVARDCTSDGERWEESQGHHPVKFVPPSLSSLKCLKMSKFYTFSQMQRAANKFLEKQTGTSDWVMNLQDRIGMLEGQATNEKVLSSLPHVPYLIMSSLRHAISHLSGFNCRSVSRRIPNWLRRWRGCRQTAAGLSL